MEIFFAGGESPTHRKHMAHAGVKRIAVNYVNLRPRLPKKKAWSFDDVVPPEVDILLYAPRSPDPDHRAFAEEYAAFAREHISRLRFVLEPGVVGAPAMRQDVWGWCPPELFVPTWTASQDVEELCRGADWVAVPEGLDGPERVRLLSAVRRHRVKMISTGSSSIEEVSSGTYDAVVSGSWLSAMRYGETMIWDGSRLRRFSARQKEQARRRFAHLIRREGFDLDKLMDEDKGEASRLALWSWRQLEDNVVKRRIRIRDEESINYPHPESDGSEVENEEGGVDTSSAEGGNLAVTPAGPPKEREQVPLPILKRSVTTDEEGQETEALELSKTTMRQCDSCVLASSCPAFKPGYQCAYNVPVSLRTKDDMMAMLNAMAEMQADRVMFTRMAEEMQGGYPDPNLSAEMDRFFGMIEKIKEINDTRDFVKIQAEVRSGSGVISRLFGPGAGERSRELPRGGLDAQSTDALMAKLQGQEIAEAEIVEE